MSNVSRQAYKDGLKEGIKLYAVWKDGVQYVGCGVYTLKQALAQVDKEFPDEDH